MQAFKLHSKTKRVIRQVITSSLMLILLVSPILATPSANAALDSGGNNNVAPPNPRNPMKYWMNQIGNIEEARNSFFYEFGDLTGTKLSVDQRSSITDGGGFIPGPDSKLKKFEGNPWFAVHPGDADTAKCLHHPIAEKSDCVDPEIALGSVKFVLSDLIYAHEPDIENPGGILKGGDYNAYVFRNEYNPALAIVIRAREGLQADDDKHFVYHRGCNDTMTEEKYRVAELDWGGHLDDADIWPTPLTDEDDRDEVQKVADGYKKLNVCYKNNSLVAGAIEGALTALKEGIDSIFEWVKDGLLNVFDIGTLTDNRGLTKAWKTIRDFVNLIFVILLSVVAFSNILRIDTEKYGVRALLPRLVFAVIAVNFSFLVVQIMTNIAYIISQPFISKGFALLSDPPADGSILDPSAGIGAFLVGALAVLVVLFALCLLFIFFIIRIVVIWMLAALSPFVFLLMVLPLTRKLANQWWTNAFRWIFMGPITFMLLYVAAELLATGSDKNHDINGPDFLLKVAFFAGACAAAIMIPLRLGGSVMSDALKGTRKGASKLPGARTLGAYRDQRGARKDEKAALRGAGLLRGEDMAKGAITAPISPKAYKAALSAGKEAREDGSTRRGAAWAGVKTGSTGGRWGRKDRISSDQGQRKLEQQEAQQLADVFDKPEMEKLQKNFKTGSKMHDRLNMAIKMREGGFNESRQAEQAVAAIKNFKNQDQDQQQLRISNLGSRNVQQEHPEILAHILGDKKLAPKLPSGAIQGIIEQGDPEKLRVVLEAHTEGRRTLGDKELESVHEKLGLKPPPSTP